jgi:uncharacterized PurR-regulated membrane protein YhhQ (DUF165 family)
MTRSLLVKLILLSTTFALVLAPAAFAKNDGRGFYGATDDKVVTNAGFILIVVFALFVFLMSMGHRALEKRKEARKAADQDYLGSHWRGGW